MAPSRPRNPLPPEPKVFTAQDYLIAGTGVVVVAVGQFLWQDGRPALGWTLVGIGGALIAGVLLRVAIAGLPRRGARGPGNPAAPRSASRSAQPTQDGLGRQEGQHRLPDRHDPTSR
jgi:hypothetical protein